VNQIGNFNNLATTHDGPSMKLLVLGSTGYHPNEHRHTACMMLPEIGVVLDAGTGMFRVGRHLQTSTLDIFLTHVHLDHVVGITYLFDVLNEKPLDAVRLRTGKPGRPRKRPKVLATDKGYDAKRNRAAARERGICPVIPYRATAKARPAFFPKALYRARARVEQLLGRLKRFQRLALRCEKTNANFASSVALALGFTLVKSVHTA
jgi:transposase